MKAIFTLLLISLIIAVNSAQAQSKKDLETDYATCITVRDSLQKELTGLSITYDSINKAYLVYDTMYSVIKEKVFQYAFDPANMPALIDSLATSRESAFSGLSTTLNDSISVLNQKNAELKAVIETLQAEGADKTDVVNDLKQLKELLDANILTQEEYDAKKAKLIEKL